MNKDIKAKWIEVLRSGRYKQGKEALKTTDNEYCCLGVLAKVLGCEWHTLRPDLPPVPHFAGKPVGRRGVFGGYLSAKFSGLSSKMQDKLADMNDSGKTFNEIADYIEHNL